MFDSLSEDHAQLHPGAIVQAFQTAKYNAIRPVLELPVIDVPEAEPISSAASPSKGLTRTETFAVDRPTSAKLGQLFDELDQNHDGTITRIEIIKAMRQESVTLGPVLGLPAQKVTQEGEVRKKFEEFFSACDTDDERGISKDEWMNHFIVEESKGTVSANEAAATFGDCFERCYDCVWEEQMGTNSGLTKTQWLAWFRVSENEPTFETADSQGQDRVCKRVCSGPSMSNCVVS